MSSFKKSLKLFMLYNMSIYYYDSRQSSCYKKYENGYDFSYRIPVFLNQMMTLMTTVMTHLQSLTLSQRADIAAYLVPEVSMID